MMNILVASRAVLKIQTGKLGCRWLPGFGRFCRNTLFNVAFPAFNGNMFARELKLCLVMVEFLSRLPAIKIVAGLAVLSKLAAMLIKMAIRAFLIQSQTGFPDIYILVETQ